MSAALIGSRFGSTAERLYPGGVGISPVLKMQVRFDTLLESHRRLGVHWSLRVENDMETVTFHSFMRTFRGTKRDKETKGNGAIALDGVCALADDLKLKLRLWTIYEPLVEYYERFGFQQTHESRPGNWRFERPYKQ